MIDFSSLNCALVTTKDASTQKDAILKLEQILSHLGITMLLENHSAKELGRNDGLSKDEIFSRTKLVICLGGDGNYIGACRKFWEYGAYLFGVHTGRLGFLTDVVIDECAVFLTELKNGKFYLQQPKFLQAKLIKGQNFISKLAFNDITLMREKINSITQIDAFLDGKYFNSYIGDGLIISSPMGSTAYNMSAGGAIMHPQCEIYAITPVCSHALTQRPLILPSNFEVEFRSNDDVVVLMDGQDYVGLKDYDSLKVGISQTSINLIRRMGHDYFDVLRQKLRWGHQ